MIFQKKIDRAMKKLHEESDAGMSERGDQAGEEEREEFPELEKNDFLAMTIAAFITILPVALLVLAGLVLFGYFFLMR